MTILYFAQAAGAAGLHEESVSPPAEPLSADELWAFLISRHPALAPMRPLCRLARNGSFATTTERFEAGDEVAILPPVSGG